MCIFEVIYSPCVKLDFAFLKIDFGVSHSLGLLMNSPEDEN